LKRSAALFPDFRPIPIKHRSKEIRLHRELWIAAATIFLSRFVPFLTDAGPHGPQLSTAELWILGCHVPVAVREQGVAVCSMKDDRRSISPPISHIALSLLVSNP
jgi:hypothetical protein